MQKQIILGDWYVIETTNGTWNVESDFESIPVSLLTSAYGKGKLLKYTECSSSDDITSIEKVTRYGARFSSPGYLECTDWELFETESEALEHLERQS